ncbi:MAG: bifunctional molybdopterin-guanine dinucleotide biosynthesis adaptor protein MobB/molybdopterin molybdotransferase MoeA [Halomonas sp.]|nr:bifunctional molybdopterin-guanine dinucleotide biosynthesis adaptor protein MobB/molybdopterin molybdotransferase MoeA [Halomonas sp.]
MSLSCFDLSEHTLSVAEAMQALHALVPHSVDIERLPLAALGNRVLAEDARSPIDVPQNTNAAMDGVALAWQAARTRYAVVGEALAGHRHVGALDEGEAVTITTGAPLPEGADTVVMREQLILDRTQGKLFVDVQNAESVRHGQNIRQAGEDIARGALALRAGTRLRAPHLGLLASLGQAEAAVYRRPRVAIFSTGDEVHAPGGPLPSDGIYDANRFSLLGMLEALGCEVLDLGILADDPACLRTALHAAAERADMVITSGGVSVGQADWVKQALQETGRLGAWRIAMRPGRPLAFGTLGMREVPFFGLPGNPVAAMVSFLQFVQPLLRCLQGETDWQPQRLTAIAEERMRSREGRVDYHRGAYGSNDEGQLLVRTTGAQGSGRLTSMVAANCLIEIEAARGEVAPGETVIIQPFGG